MRLVRLGLLFVLAACGAAPLAPVAVSPQMRVLGDGAPPARSGHVYVAVTTSTHYPSVERFKLVNGVPESSPDRVYKGYGGLVAVSSNGTMYAFGNYSQGGIYAFGPRGNKPLRKIEFSGPRHCGDSSGEETSVSALASDAQGNLFAAIYTYAGGRPRRVPCNGVAIFAPDANGKVAPVQTISLPDAIITGIAVDASDNLYVAELPYTVVEFTNAVSGPKPGRVFHTESPTHVSSIATDGAGDVFISNINYGYQTGWIDRYAPHAKGKGPPTSQIVLQGSKLHDLIAIAAGHHELFVADGYDSVDLYHARQNGGQSPFDSLAANDPSSVAVGP